MARFTSNTVLDKPWEHVKNNTTRQIATAGQPTDYNDATSNKNLGEVSMDPSDFTISDGSVSGRRVDVASKSGGTVNNSGDADHAALVDDNNSVLLYVTTATQQTLTAGNSITFQSFGAEFRDPSAP